MLNNEELKFLHPKKPNSKGKIRIRSKYIYIKYLGSVTENLANEHILKLIEKRKKLLLNIKFIVEKNVNLTEKGYVQVFLAFNNTFETKDNKFFNFVNNNIETVFAGIDNPKDCLKYMYPDNYDQIFKEYEKTAKDKKVEIDPIINYLPVSQATLDYYNKNNELYEKNLAIHNAAIKENPICGGSVCKHKKAKHTCIHRNLLVISPELCRYWDFTLNMDVPQHYSSLSNFLIHWLCQKSKCDHMHLYTSTICNVAREQVNYCCHFCRTYNRVPCECNNLLKTHPELCKQINEIQYTDEQLKTRLITKNCIIYEDKYLNSNLITHKIDDETYFIEHKIVDLKKVHYFHSLLVTWKCDNCISGCHVWNAMIVTRTTLETGCTYCKGGSICMHDNLSTRYPEISSEWDYKNNRKNTSLVTRTPEMSDSEYDRLLEEKNSPDKFSCGSEVKVFWMHVVKGVTHRWKSTIYNRTHIKSSCVRCTGQFSKAQIAWLDGIMKNENIFIQHAANIGERKIPGIGKVDGYHKDEKTGVETVYEFNGDYWHGNPNKFKPENINKTTGKYFGVLLQNTYKKQDKIINAKYNFVVKWESDFPSQEIVDQILKTDYSTQNINSESNILVEFDYQECADANFDENTIIDYDDNYILDFTDDDNNFDEAECHNYNLNEVNFNNCNKDAVYLNV